MRLGDLDALKEDFKSRLAKCNEWIEKAKDKETKIRASAVKAFIGEVIMTIDNAPTVDTTCPHCDSGYAQGLSDGYLKGKEERPQGEWIEKVETKQLGHGWLTTHEIVCSVCGGSGENDENIPQCWKFCPNCGADMREDSDK